MKLSWQEQQKYLHTKHKSQIRYHPTIIKYCLSTAEKSSSAYEPLRLDIVGMVLEYWSYQVNKHYVIIDITLNQSKVKYFYIYYFTIKLLGKL